MLPKLDFYCKRDSDPQEGEVHRSEFAAVCTPHMGLLCTGRSLTGFRRKRGKKGRKGKKRTTRKRSRRVSLTTITTEEVTCIARTTVREVVRTADAEVHAAAGVNFSPLSMHVAGVHIRIHDNIAVAMWGAIMVSVPNAVHVASTSGVFSSNHRR
jgi:hypothetical protein